MGRLDPCAAVVEAGEPDVDGLTDYSPDGHQARADLAAHALRRIEALPATPLHAHLAERLRAGSPSTTPGRTCGNCTPRPPARSSSSASASNQRCRAATPGRAAAEDGWAHVGARQAAIPAALDGYAQSLLLAAARVTCRPGVRWSW
ncbi:hypothetical protein V2I01_40630 [Micromonospora sp. BRA006-A]|nr:hypothetical protein [Micromonospora sp. BRA006-A]